MAWEPISPELALIDPDLAARARAGLEEPAPALSPSRPAGAAAPAPAAVPGQHHPYPFWARVTAAVWLLALGIMVGGAAIPHAQDRPRVIPRTDDLTVAYRQVVRQCPTSGERAGHRGTTAASGYLARALEPVTH